MCGNPVEESRVHRDILGERPVPVHSEDGKILADIGYSHPAVPALPAVDYRFADYSLSLGEIGDVLSDGGDLARELVTHDYGNLCKLLISGGEVVEAQIAAAD